MIDVLGSIVDFLVSIFNFVARIITEIIYIIKLTGSVMSNIASYFYFLPAVVSTAIITLITIAVAYKIVGRD